MMTCFESHGSPSDTIHEITRSVIVHFVLFRGSFLFKGRKCGLPIRALLTKPSASVIAFRMNAPPPRAAFTAKEWQLIQRMGTPRQVQRWLTSTPYNWERQGGTMRSFREVVKRNEAHCLEASVAAAVILEQHGYPPLLLDLESWDLLDHVLFVFQENGLWGAIARSRDIGLHGRRPVFRALRQLVWS